MVYRRCHHLPQGIDVGGQTEPHEGLLPHPQPHPLYPAQLGLVPALGILYVLCFIRGAQIPAGLHWQGPLGTPEKFLERDYLASTPPDVPNGTRLAVIVRSYPPDVPNGTRSAGFFIRCVPLVSCPIGTFGG